MRNISAWSIRNPVPPLLLFTLLTIMGAVSFWQMKITAMPDISAPLVSVTVTQPSAAPTEMETQITQKIEGAIAGIGNVKNMSSVVEEGLSVTSVEFHIGTNVDRATNDVRDAVAKVRSDLPEGILEPQVERIDISGGALAYVAVESTAMTLEQLSWFVDNTLTKRMVSIPGVAQVSRSGGVSREIRVHLDPARLQSYGLTAAQVNAQLRALNLDVPGGRTELSGAEQAIRVLGGARTALQLGATRIPIGNGRDVRLSDIAEVTDGTSEQREIGRLNGRQVTSFGLFMAKGASDVTVYDNMQEQLDLLAAEYPVTFRELFTTVNYTKESYSAAIASLVEGAILAVIVVFFFLRDWRATLISALAIPLSAIPTFLFMDFLGFTLNTISLLALTLVAGILVDDAIVEIENIVRHMRMGKSAYQAALEAADEIGMAVVATTFSIIAVFVPVSFMEGISGQFFRQFGLTVAISVFMSLLVARLITPLIAAFLLQAHGASEYGESRLMRGYLRLLDWTIHHRWKVVGAGVLSFFLTIFLFVQIPQAFQPEQDFSNSIVQVEMIPGTTLENTMRTVDRAIEIVNAQPEVRSVYESVGEAGEVRRANLYIELVPRGDRDISTRDFERRIAGLLNQVPDARINFQSMASMGGQTRDIIIMLAGDDPNLLNETAERVESEMRGLDVLRDARIDDDLERPEILIRPRFDVAAEMGVSVASLSETIRIATIGDIEQNMAKFSLADRQIPIRVSLVEASRTSLATLRDLPVPTVSGGTVPLNVVADISLGAGPTRVHRYNQTRRVTLMADLNGVQFSQGMEAIQALPSMRDLPAGVREVKFGEAEIMEELVGNFALAIATGILLVFAVLVLLYRRVMPPFVNMASLLLAPLGAMIALILTGHVITMPVYIGLLMLIGIVAKNSILLVDFAIEEMRKGVDRDTAILDAGHKRAQPIIMTTVAMTAGMLPAALSLHGDSGFRAPMAIAVIGGLLLSTVLTLVIVPAGFTLADDLERWIGKRLGRIVNADRAHHPVTGAGPAE